MARYYKNLTADTLVKEGAGTLHGIFVASTSSGTIKVWDAMSAAAPILINTFTPTAPAYYDMGRAGFTRGLYVDISNTIDCTVIYE